MMHGVLAEQLYVGLAVRVDHLGTPLLQVTQLHYSSFQNHVRLQKRLPKYSLRVLDE